MSTKSNFDIQFDVHNEFSDILKTAPVEFTHNNVEYNIIHVNNQSPPATLFRRKDNPTCFIDFLLDYAPLFTNDTNKEFVRYKNFIYINYFQCSNVNSTKGDGLKMLVAFVNYIYRQVISFNAMKRENNQHFNFEIDTLQLSAEPYNPQYLNLQSRIKSNDLRKLLAYYRKLGFYYVNPDDKHNTEEPILMEADFDAFYWKYRVVTHSNKDVNKSRVSRRNTRRNK